MKIYTKFGDGGETYLASGIKVQKTDPQVGLYGTCDELNSQLGLCISLMPKETVDPKFLNFLLDTQHLLFEVGSELAGYIPKDNPGSVIYDEDIKNVEFEIDRLTEKLTSLKHFVLPGGSPSASALHVTRTVCRRLERDVLCYVKEGGSISHEIKIYLNRLSDYFFTAARYSNFLEGITETIWKSRTKT